MNIVIIGGSGHVGTYLVPELVRRGHTVVNVSRQMHKPYSPSHEWNDVRQLTMDRVNDDDFCSRIAALRADVVIDMICFTRAGAEELVNVLHGKIEHFVHCGSMWVHGHSEYVPATESQPREPICNYGKQKLAIENYMLEMASKGFPATVLHPGHITGPGWLPINPAGNLDPTVFTKLAKGEKVALPNMGMETLHHVHAADVAAAFLLAINNREKALGEAFHVVSEQAITLRGYARQVASWFGRSPNLSFVCWESWAKMVSEYDAMLTFDHISHSPNGSIEKAKRLLGFQPLYSSMEAVREAVDWQIRENNLLKG